MATKAKTMTAVRVLKVLTLVLVILLAVLLGALLFSFLTMLFVDGNVQIDSGGILDFVLRRTQHGSATIPSNLVFLGALPLMADVLLLLADTSVLYRFLKKAKNENKLLFSGGRGYLIAMTVLGALTAAVPFLCSKAVAAAVAASGTFAVKSWNPLGGILLFAVTLAILIVYGRKQTQKLPEEV